MFETNVTLLKIIWRLESRQDRKGSIDFCVDKFVFPNWRPHSILFARRTY